MIFHNDWQDIEKFSEILKRKVYRQNKNLAFVCIGTNKVMGDSIGPRIGSYLKNTTDLEVYGDLEKNICTKKDIEKINKKVENKYIIAIDSALSKSSDIGKIYIVEKKISLGNGLNLCKGSIGDISIKVVVAENDNDNYKNFLNLKNVDLSFIQNLTYRIGNGILVSDLKSTIF